MLSDLFRVLARAAGLLRLTALTRALLEGAARTNRLEHLSEAAGAALDVGLTQDAETYARRALAIDGEDARSRHILAASLNQQQQFVQAASEYRRLATTYPNDVTAHYNLGVCLTNLKQWGEAIDAFARAVQLQPDAADASSRLGIAYAEAGRPELATVWLSKALRLEPTEQSYVNLVVNLLDRGDAEDAESVLRDGLRQMPNSDNLKVRLAFALAQQHRWSEALQVQRSVDSMPKDPESLVFVSGLYRAAGELQEAAAAAADAVRAAPNMAEPYVALGLTYLQMQQLVDAEQAFDAGLSKSEEHPECLAGKAAVLVHEGKLAEAQGLLGRLRPEDLAQLETRSEFTEYLARVRSSPSKLS